MNKMNSGCEIKHFCYMEQPNSRKVNTWTLHEKSKGQVGWPNVLEEEKLNFDWNL